MNQQSQTPQNTQSLEDSQFYLKLDLFKIQKCELQRQHNSKNCPFYHNAKDRKRDGNFYRSELCQFIEKNMDCPQNEECQFSHNFVEQIYRTSKYKTKFCSNFPDKLNQCQYGIFCGYAHSEEEIKVPLIHLYEIDNDFFMFHFKTIFCPFNLFEHDRADCLYAHNWQDFRRKMDKNNQYQAQECIYWNSHDFLVSYQNGCPNGFDCNHSHGWKELQFHPLVYRTNPCQLTKCTNVLTCPNYHHFSQKRVISPLLSNQVFLLTERNRTINNQVNSQLKNFIPIPPGLITKVQSEKIYQKSKCQQLQIHQNLSQVQKQIISCEYDIQQNNYNNNKKYQQQVNLKNSNFNILKDNLYCQFNIDENYVEQQSLKQQFSQNYQKKSKKPLNKDSQIYLNEINYLSQNVKQNTDIQQNDQTNQPAKKKLSLQNIFNYNQTVDNQSQNQQTNNYNNNQLSEKYLNQDSNLINNQINQ